MIAPKGASQHGGTHGKRPPVFPVRFGKVSDPILDDLLASATAMSLELATSQVKHLAVAGAISVQSASRWRIEGKGNPLFDLTRIVYRLMQMGQHAGALVAHTMSALSHALMPISDADLVARFWSLMDDEAVKEGRENQAQNGFARSGDLKALERATMDEAGTQVELAACARELRRRRIDPREWRGN